MTEEEYYRITRACDALLKHPDASPARIAIPWLHVLNEHPIYLSRYADLDGSAAPQIWRAAAGRAFDRALRGAYKTAWLGRNMLRAAVQTARQGRNWQGQSGAMGRFSGGKRVHAIIVSHLVSAEHLQEMDDFYFGNLQALLADRGVLSLLLLRNQTGRPTRELSKQAERDGSCARRLLPDVATFAEELRFLGECIMARRRLHRAKKTASSLLERQVARKASASVVSGEVLASVRLYSQIVEICRQARPSMVLTLYEGHGWERLVWHAARNAGNPVLCVGYQHTILRKHSYALKRSLDHGGLYDPDLILTVGDVTRRILEVGEDLRGVRICTFGSHRRQKDGALPERPRLVPAFLVLPEGIESECLFLFNYALECARRLRRVRFILRTHPVLPFEKIERKLKGLRSLPQNVEVSQDAPLEKDFERAGFILYRGSSTVIYGVLRGLKPFYIGKRDEMSIDPLDELMHWRERVMSIEDLVGLYAGLQSALNEDYVDEWRKAREFCDMYVRPLSPAILEELIGLAEHMSNNHERAYETPILTRR